MPSRVSAAVATAKVTTLTEPKCAPSEAASAAASFSARKTGYSTKGMASPSSAQASTWGPSSAMGCLDSSTPPFSPMASSR